MAVKDKKGLAFKIAVILLSVAVVGLIANFFISKFLKTSGRVAAEQAVQNRIARGFSCTANISWHGSSYEVSISKTKTDFNMGFLKPQILTPLSFEANGNSIDIKYGKLSAAVDPSSIPQTSLFKSVNGAFDASSSSSSSKASISVKPEGKGVVFSGDTNVGKFILVVGYDLTPKTLSLPSLDLTATFKNFKYN